MEKAEEILKGGDFAFGFCDFSQVRDFLLECRASARLPKDAKTVICFAFPYKTAENPPKNISRYAAVPDYHTVCGKILANCAEKLAENYKGHSFVPFCDNSPIPEVRAAAAAGLGVRGENGLLITKKYGSFVFLGEIVTDMCFKAENKTANCPSCGKCKAACPVGLKKEDCLSALTQKKGALTEKEKQKIINGGSVWGCDICQNACPLNEKAQNTQIPEFAEGYRDKYIKGENPENRAYLWRGISTVERNADLF